MFAVIANLVCAVLFAGLLQLAYFLDRGLFIISALTVLGFLLMLAKLDKIEIALSEARRQRVAGTFGKVMFLLLASALVIGSSLAIHHLRGSGLLDHWLVQSQRASPPREGDSAGQAVDINNRERTGAAEELSSKGDEKPAETGVGEGGVELVEVIESKQPDNE